MCKPTKKPEGRKLRASSDTPIYDYPKLNKVRAIEVSLIDVKGDETFEKMIDEKSH